MENTSTVIVTGGGKGIGASITEAFHAAGYHVAIASRQDSGLAERLGARARFFQADIGSRTDTQELVRKTLSWTGQLDVMVNNAGFSQWRPLAEIDEAFWERMIGTNLRGTLWGGQAAVAHLQPGGSIINISSLAGKRGSANNSAYCAAKFGVNGLTQAWAKELGPRGIRVNAICPVYVRTAGLLEALAETYAPPSGKDIETYLAEFAASQAALKVLPTGEQLGQTCIFLASPAASAITGQCINVDCGVMPQ